MNRQSPPDAFGQIRRVLEDDQGVPLLFSVSGLDTLDKRDRVDGIHLSESGEWKAARLWADALDANFFKTTIPWLPKLVAELWSN